MTLHSLSLKLRLWLIAGLALLGSLALLAVSARAIEEVKIRGPLYQNIVAYKDLLADILPPPAYLIESYLTCFEVLKAKGPERTPLLEKAATLEKEFRERHAVWDKQLTHAGIRTAFLDQATPPALEFFRILKESYLPLARQGQDEEARKVLEGPLSDAYQKHRAAIDATVELANREVTAVEAKADSSLTANAWLLYLAALLINAFVLALTFLTIRSITRPLGTLTAYAQRVGAGDYAAACGVLSQDEIGQLGNVLCTTVEAVQQSLKRAADAGQLAQTEADNARQAMADATNASSAAEAKSRSLLQAAGQLELVVDVIRSASQQLAVQVEQASSGAEVQSSRAAETATAMEEMNATVLEVARNASQAADSSGSAKAKALEGEAIVARVVAGIGAMQQVSQAMKQDMEALGQQAQGIGQVMNVISDIADQTNLLALNAAIEAARAGDAGRGFAVVADEVRKLAEKTMVATREVGEAISGIQQGARKNLDNVEHAVRTVDEATGLANQSGAALREIVSLVEVASDQVRSIATASEEQSAASEEINRSIEDINRISAETSGSMRQSSGAVGEVAAQADHLHALIDKMKQSG